MFALTFPAVGWFSITDIPFLPFPQFLLLLASNKPLELTSVPPTNWTMSSGAISGALAAGVF
jgi:hypothetical protein